MEEIKLTPRDYQTTIFKTCLHQNCLVVLPTGTGKTLIALMLAVERFKKYPLEKILILAPTRPLIEQHMKSFQNQLPEDWADMQLFTGKTVAEQRKKIWQTAEWIFSTPQCISNDLKNNLYALEDVSLLVVDECHRCLKNYAYNLIAQKYNQQAAHPRVLGLTASPGANKKTITKVCENLGIKAVEIRTRESHDVRPHLQELEFEKIELDFPPEFEEIRQLLQKICRKKVEELKSRKVLFGFASKTSLIEAQRKIMRAISSGTKSINMFVVASVCAQSIKLQHALELLETQTLSSFIEYMKKVFEEAKQKKSKASQRLANDKTFNTAYTLATTIEFEHPKLEKLKEIISAQMKKQPQSKIIIFSQFRDTVNKIKSTLEQLPGVRPVIFVGQAIKKHSSGKITGLKQSEQQEIIRKFSKGEFNVLVATSIAEEGLDIPEVHEVIFYEPIPSAIRKIQRAGRTARLIPGSLKILITRNTRDQAFHYASQAKEKKMHQAIDEIKNKMDNGNNLDQQKLF